MSPPFIKKIKKEQKNKEPRNYKVITNKNKSLTPLNNIFYAPPIAAPDRPYYNTNFFYTDYTVLVQLSYH